MFHDRIQAGCKLAEMLIAFRNQPGTLVIGLARGGIVVASEIANALSLPLNICIPKKIGAPGNPELALGAITEHSAFWNEDLISSLHVQSDYLKQEAQKARTKLHERLSLYQKYLPSLDIRDKTILLVDDGIATGATFFASINEMRELGAKKIIAIAPVISSSAQEILKTLSDDVFSLYIGALSGISLFYENFSEVRDEEVISLLKNRKKY